MWSAFISEESDSSKNGWEDSETSSSKFQPPLLVGSYSKASRQSSYFTPPYFSYIRACCALATVLRLNEFKIRTKTQIEGHVAD